MAVSMSSLTSQRAGGGNVVPDRKQFSARLPHEWMPEDDFKAAVRRISRLAPWDNAGLAGVMHSLFYFHLIQYRRRPRDSAAPAPCTH